MDYSDLLQNLINVITAAIMIVTPAPPAPDSTNKETDKQEINTQQQPQPETNQTTEKAEEKK